jgi:hypothetical protein
MTPHGEAVVLRDDGPTARGCFGRQVEYRWRHGPMSDWRRREPMWKRDRAGFERITVLRGPDLEGHRITRLARDLGTTPHMTETQFRRWRDFAVRMARVCYGDSKRPTHDWILRCVERVIDRVYDHGLVEVVDWDERVTDEVKEFLWDEEPYFRGRIEDQEDERHSSEDRIERRIAAAHAQWDEQFCGPVQCCVRAGIDMATSIGGGVVGFTVGDLRQMYPEGIPTWIRRHYDCDMDAQADDAGIWL